MKRLITCLLAVLMLALPCLAACEVTVDPGDGSIDVTDPADEGMTIEEAYTEAVKEGYLGSLKDFRKKVEAAMKDDARIDSVSAKRDTINVYLSDGTKISFEIEEDEGDNTPTNPDNGNDTPTTPDDGNDTPTNPDDGDDTPTTPDDGNDTPTTPDDGDDTPTTPDDGDDTPTTPDNGDDTPTTPDNGEDTNNPSITIKYTLEEAIAAAKLLGFTGVDADVIESAAKALGIDTTAVSDLTFVKVEKIDTEIWITPEGGNPFKLSVSVTPPADEPDPTDTVIEEVTSLFADLWASSCEAIGTVTSPDGTIVKDIESVVSEVTSDSHLSIPYFNYFHVDENGVITPPDTMDGSLSGSPSSTKKLNIDLSTFDFDRAFFKNGEITYESNEINAIITDSEGFFGVDLSADEITFRVEVRNDMPKRVYIDYTDDQGYTISVKLTYFF